VWLAATCLLLLLLLLLLRAGCAAARCAAAWPAALAALAPATAAAGAVVAAAMDLGWAFALASVLAATTAVATAAGQPESIEERPPPPPFKPEMPCGSTPCGPSNQVCARTGSTHYAPPNTRYTFHLTDASCGIGDPNGPFYDPLHKVYHLFHQDSLALPHASRGGVIGHWASRDFLHWTQLPVPLWNDQWYDYVAVWSGSVTVVNGTPHFIYPGKCAGDGVSNPLCHGFTYNLATPSNRSDPLLKNWSNWDSNPLLNGTGDDPSEAWRTTYGEWRLIGNQPCTQGSSEGAPIYASTDFLRWSKVGCTTLKLGDCPTLFERPPLVPGERMRLTAAMPTHVHKAGSGNDQLQAGVWTDGKPGAPGTWEQIGGSINLDNGATHASKNFYDPVFNRSIMWVWGTVHGGIQTVPREMHYHPQLGRVVFTPAREMIRLRKTPMLAQVTAAELNTTQPVRLNASSSSELLIHIGLPKGDMQISISLLGGAGTVFVNLTRSTGGNGSAVCGFRSPDVCGGHDCPIPCVGMTPCYTDSFDLLPSDTDLEVRLFLDGNTRAGGEQYAVAEAYFQHGRVAMTMPINASCTSSATATACSWDAAISASGKSATVVKKATSYQLGSIWVSEEQVLRDARSDRVKTDDATSAATAVPAPPSDTGSAPAPPSDIMIKPAAYEVYDPIVTHSWVVESGKSDLKYNHDSSIAEFDGTWITVWNANTLHLEARPGQINYQSTSADRQAWSAPVPAFSGPASSNPVEYNSTCMQWQPNLVLIKGGAQLGCAWSQGWSQGTEVDGCFADVTYWSVLDKSPQHGGRWVNRKLEFDGGNAHKLVHGVSWQIFPTQVRKRVFLRQCFKKTIIVPRQARDKLRDNTKKSGVSPPSRIPYSCARGDCWCQSRWSTRHPWHGGPQS
jgi:sucrose-6-phosphate hydrolase SacC (GH32 family)